MALLVTCRANLTYLPARDPSRRGCSFPADANSGQAPTAHDVALAIAFFEESKRADFETLDEFLSYRRTSQTNCNLRPVSSSSRVQR
jgi:hypothetical protein